MTPLSPTNAEALRETLPKLKPRPLSLTTSAGFRNRLGLATPGHVRALERVLGRYPGTEILPIFAQQSISEMTRTKRTPREILDDATWGAFEAGWQAKVGADADHLKTPADIDACVDAGFSLFTIDPGDYVDNEAHAANVLTFRLDRLIGAGHATAAQWCIRQVQRKSPYQRFAQ